MVKEKSGNVCGKRGKLVIATTVPETLATILKGQPRRLAQSFDVTLISSCEDELLCIARDEGVPAQTVPMVRGIDLFRDAWSLVRMCIVLARIRPDIVHSYTPKAGLIAMLAAWLCRVPIRVHTFTGLIFPTATGFRQRLLIWIDRLICASATHVVPEGLGVKHDLERFGITSKQLKVIGSGNIAGIDTEHFSSKHQQVVTDALGMRHSLNLPQDAFLFCFVGRLNQDKGLFELVSAFDDLDTRAHLLVVGGLDASAPISQGLQKRMAEHPRIHILGFLSDVRPALAASSILVLPSYREGFPNVVLQAGAMRIPVIATDINGCNEIIKPGKNGWLVRVRSIESLRQAMMESMKVSEELLQKMGDFSRSLIQQQFERLAHWERMEDFYLSLSPKGARRHA